MAHEIPEAARHVEPRIARVLRIHTVVRVAVENNAAPGLFDPGPLVLQVRLVVARKRDALGVVLAAFRAADHGRGVGDMGHGELVVHMVVEAHGGRGPGHLRAELLHAVGGGDQALCLLEDIRQHRRHLVGLESRVPDDQLRQILFHEIRYVVAFLAMTVEHSVDREIVHLEDEPRILVWAFRLQALSACEAQAAIRGVDLIAHLLHGLVCEGRLPVVSLGPDTHLPALLAAAHLDDGLFVEGGDQASVLLGVVAITCFLAGSIDVADTESTAGGFHLGLLSRRRRCAAHGC
mmetsp:Transcript_16587/g.47093  ORF Transcript_16587/g.47093 Transcript_16587/m.47093 type:complete len:292 (-) Transcript_16587:92-967(-)